MPVLTKLLGLMVGLAMAFTDLTPAKAMTFQPLPVFTGYGDVIEVGRRLRRGRSFRRHRGFRRNRGFRRHRRHRNRAIVGSIIGGAIIGGAIARSNRRRYDDDYYYRSRRYYRPRRYDRRAPVYYERPRIVYRSVGNAHVNWCYRRFRSYRAYDNTYQPYHGPRRHCVSPY